MLINTMKYKFLFFVFVSAVSLAQPIAKADKRKSPNDPAVNTNTVTKSSSTFECVLMPFETTGEQRRQSKKAPVTIGSTFSFDANMNIDKKVYDLENDLIKRRSDILNQIINLGDVVYNIRTHNVSLSLQEEGKYKLSFRVSFYANSKDPSVGDVFLTMIDETYVDGELKSDAKFHKLVHFKNGAVVASASLSSKCSLKLMFNPTLYGLFKELEFVL